MALIKVLLVRVLSIRRVVFPQGAARASPLDISFYSGTCAGPLGVSPSLGLARVLVFVLFQRTGAIDTIILYQYYTYTYLSMI